VNPWTAAAVVLLLSLLPLGYVLVREPRADALVALELAGTIVVLVLILLAQAFSRSSYYVVPLTLAPMSLVGGLLFVRFLPIRR
jgi:multisubunit Na+/H+ antiporter MnhF subunit